MVVGMIMSLVTGVSIRVMRITAKMLTQVMAIIATNGVMIRYMMKMMRMIKMMEITTGICQLLERKSL